MIRSLDVTTGQVTISAEDAPTNLPDDATRLARKRNSAWLSRFQLRAVLADMGRLAEARTAMQAATGRVALAWADGDRFRRTGPLMAALGVALGLSDAELDALCDAGAAIDA